MATSLHVAERLAELAASHTQLVASYSAHFDAQRESAQAEINRLPEPTPGSRARLTSRLTSMHRATSQLVRTTEQIVAMAQEALNLSKGARLASLSSDAQSHAFVVMGGRQPLSTQTVNCRDFTGTPGLATGAAGVTPFVTYGFNWAEMEKVASAEGADDGVVQEGPDDGGEPTDGTTGEGENQHEDDEEDVINRPDRAADDEGNGDDEEADEDLLLDLAGLGLLEDGSDVDPAEIDFGSDEEEEGGEEKEDDEEEQEDGAMDA